MIKQTLKRFSYAVFPRRCALCAEVVEVDANLCDECKNAKIIEGNVCTKCGREKSHCTCKKDKFSPKYKMFTAMYYYSGSIERGIIRFKDEGYYELADGMSKCIAKQVSKEFKDANFDLITCVPMTKRKLKKRGYNQSELLAHKTGEILNIEYKPLLVKIRNTPSQRFSSAKERRINLFGAFDLAKDADVEDKTILLIDDVKTTGSTLSECAAMLKAYGAKEVYAASFAVTDKKESAHSDKSDEK